MSEHIPGPWVVRSPKNDCRAFDVYPESNPWTKLHHGHWGGEGTARLIAAAPDLLAMLEEVADEMENHADADSDGCNWEHEWLGRVREVIAKARGK